MEQEKRTADCAICCVICSYDSHCMRVWSDTSSVVRLLSGNCSCVGDLIGTVIMSFSSFGYYGQIWFNRDYTYECAVEEMPAGYADTLMAVSPTWAFALVVIVGVIISVAISNVTAKIFKLEK